jgi:hypothetical protein
MRPNEYAINLTSILFWLEYGEIDRHLSHPTTSIYRHYNWFAYENIEVIAQILFRIIHREAHEKGYTEATEQIGKLYALQTRDPKNFHNLIIWLNMRGRIGPYELLAIRI